MAAGPGRYDEAATAAREATKAVGVVLIVVRGDKGSGFDVQMPPEELAILPDVLEDVAREIRADMNRAPEARKW